MVSKSQELEGGNIRIIDPEVNIMSCLALSNVVVSDESNCLTEALLFEVPGISVTDWLIPAMPWAQLPSRLPDVPSCAIKTTRADLLSAVQNTLRDRDRLRPHLRQYRDHYFSNLGKSSILIMDVLEAVLSGDELPVQPLVPQKHTISLD